jgi:hypothetical protein
MIVGGFVGVARTDFDAALDFVATGGYALKACERFARIKQGKDGRWRVGHPMVAQCYRMNVGTIIEADMLKVRLVRSRASRMIPRGGRLLGQVEEFFIETLAPGDTFIFAGEILRYEALIEDEVYVSRTTAEVPKVPAYGGGKFPLSTYLADRVRKIISDQREWLSVPDEVRERLEIQEWRSLVPRPEQLLVETFPDRFGVSTSAKRALEIDPHQVTRDAQRSLVGEADVGHDILHELRSDELDRHVLGEMLLQHRIRGVEMAEVGRNERFRPSGDRDPAEVERAGMCPSADACLAAKIDGPLRKRALVDEQVAILRELDQSIAGRGVAAEHERLSVHRVQAQREAR